MTLQDAFTIVWRRRWIVLLFLVIGGLAAWMSGGSADSNTATYRSDATLTLAADEETRSLDLYTYIATETSEIQDRVEESLGAPLEGTVSVRSIQEIRAIRIAVTGQPDEATAAQVVATYAKVLNEFATTGRVVDRDDRLQRIRLREAELQILIEDLSDELKRLQRLQPDEESGQPVDPVLETEFVAASNELADVLRNQADLQAETERDLTPFEALGAPTVEEEPIDADPLGPNGRLVVGILLGLGLGVILALGLQRFDTRLFSRRDAEAAYDLPVLAEIPKIPWRQRRSNRIIAREQPTGTVADSFRVLRSGIARARATQLTEADETKHKPGTVVLVTSASAAVGKSTTVANLAAVAADAGRSVLVVGADLRHPTIHEYFGIDQSVKGLSHACTQRRSGETPEIEDYILSTTEPGVKFMSHGTTVANPGDLLAFAVPLFDEARQLFDLVIIDTPPMLAGNDVDELLPSVDLTLQVARSGRTTADEGLWADEAIQRRHTPTCGLVLIGVRSDLERRSSARRRLGVRHHLRELPGRVVAGTKNTSWRSRRSVQSEHQAAAEPVEEVEAEATEVVRASDVDHSPTPVDDSAR